MKHKISVGNIYTIDGDVLLLVQIGTRKVALISIRDSNRYMEGVKVKDIFNISKKEFKKILDNESPKYVGNGKEALIKALKKDYLNKNVIINENSKDDTIDKESLSFWIEELKVL